MTIITKQEINGSGKYLSWINYEGLNTFIVETNTQLLENEAVVIKDKYLDNHLYETVSQIIIYIYDFKENIRNAIVFMKTTNPNLTQWDNYLNSRPWDESLMVRWFLARLASELANKKEFDLSVYTETEVLSKLKTWIIYKPARELEKVLFGM